MARRRGGLAVRLDAVAEPSHEWRAELTPQLDRLRERVGRLEHDLAGTAPAGAVEALTDRLDDIAQRLEKNERRLEKLARRAEELAPLHRVEGLIDAIADTAGKQSAIHERLDGLDATLSETRTRTEAMEPFAGRVRELEHRLSNVRDELAEAAADQSSAHAEALEAMRDELAEQGRRTREAAEARDAENGAVQARLTHVEVSLTDANTRVAALEPLQARLNELELTLAEATSAEAAARRSDLNAVRSEIAALGGELAKSLAQLTERDEQDEAAMRATAQAIRDGLAELGAASRLPRRPTSRAGAACGARSKASASRSPRQTAISPARWKRAARPPTSPSSPPRRATASSTARARLRSSAR